MSYVKLINLTKHFGKSKVIDKINLEIKKGEIISLLGPSGCGKSTTLKLIAGLLKTDSGDILFNDNSILDLHPEKRNAIIVFQDYLLFPHMNVYENIAFGLKMKKIKKSKIDTKVKELLDLIKLNGYEYKYPSELSGGQKQRVAIARALAVEPKTLLLDEPFSNLDINLRHEMREFVLEIQKKKEITMILVTHDKEEALMMSNKIAVILNGQIKQFDKPNNLYKNPNSKEVANIFGERNYMIGCIKDGIFKNDIIEINLGIDDTVDNVEIMISKEDIRIYPERYEHGNKAMIVKKVYSGDRTYYNLKIKDYILKVSCSEDSFKENEIVKFEFKSENIKYFNNK